jgi:hypothetical protein
MVMEEAPHRGVGNRELCSRWTLEKYSDVTNAGTQVYSCVLHVQ